jgi:hypothetical protein
MVREFQVKNCNAGEITHLPGKKISDGVAFQYNKIHLLTVVNTVHNLKLTSENSFLVYSDWPSRKCHHYVKIIGQSLLFV